MSFIKEASVGNWKMSQDDPFGFLAELSQISLSQEEALEALYFVGQTDVFPKLDDADSGRPPESTGNVMVSTPVSERDGNPPNERYQTPPEGSLLARSDERGQPPPADDSGSGPHSSGPVVVGKVCAVTEGAVDLGLGWPKLGPMGVVSPLVIDRNGVVHGVCSSCDVGGMVETEGFDSQPVRYVVSPREPNDISIEPASKKLKVYDSNLGPFENAHQMNEDLPLNESEVEVVAFSKGNEMNKHGQNVSSSHGGGGGAQTGKSRGVSSQPSASGKAKKNAAGTENQILKELLEALIMVAGRVDGGAEGEEEEEESDDFLETAKRRGMTFPRPRWWPPEGLDD